MHMFEYILGFSLINNIFIIIFHILNYSRIRSMKKSYLLISRVGYFL